MRLDQRTQQYQDIGDRDDLDYDEKLAEYSRITEEHFDTENYLDFCDEHLSDLDEIVLDYFQSPEFDRLVVETVESTFPATEHDEFIPHYRGLVSAWTADQGTA
jgi:hypothetical protein